MDKIECERLAQELFTKHNLLEWKLVWKKKLVRWSTAGSCNYRKKIITLQPTYVEKNGVEEITNTILHEIAHALMPRHHHNKFWKRKAIEIGCTGSVHYSSKVIK